MALNDGSTSKQLWNIVATIARTSILVLLLLWVTLLQKATPVMISAIAVIPTGIALFASIKAGNKIRAVIFGAFLLFLGLFIAGVLLGFIP